MKFIRFVYVLILMLPLFLSAQTNVTNTGILYIGSATDTFFVGGSFSNTSTAALTSNGVVNVKRDLSNSQAGMSANAGNLILDGTIAQIVGGTQPFKTNSFISNNANGITLNNNLSVSGVHTFTAGMITTSSTPNYMIYENGASYTGSNDSRHVDGWVKKIGNGNFTFPVGSAMYERPVALSGLTATSEFDVRRYPRVTPNFIQLFSPLVLIDTSEYWMINKISGGSAIVNMNWNTSKVPFPSVTITDVKVAYYDAGIGFWTEIGGTPAGNTSTIGTVFSNSVSAFNNYFTMGSISITLPLQITGFAAKRMNNYHLINWSIASELNVNHYELEKSTDGISFVAIKNIFPLNNNLINNYDYEDRNIANGKTYYRLKIIGNNSLVKYSKVVEVAGTVAKDHDFYVIKNPVSNSIDIFAAENVKGNYQYKLVSSSGQVMQSGILNIGFAGVQQIAIQRQIAAGTYVLIVSNGVHNLQKTIVKN